MLNYVIFLTVVTTLNMALCQRPSYAGTSVKGYPSLASRFQDTETPASTGSVTLGVRAGGDESSNTVAPLPVDARGDVDLVNRLNSWPRENRPFWLLNAEQIEKNRREQAQANRNQEGINVVLRGSFGNSNNRDSIPVRPDPPRSSFLGPVNN